MTINYRIKSDADRPVLIYIRFNLKGKGTIEASTTFKVNPKYWSRSKQRTKAVNPTLKNLNRQLDLLDLFIVDAYNNNKNLFDRDYLKRLIDEFNNVDDRDGNDVLEFTQKFIESKSNEWAVGTRRAYVVFNKVLIKYLKQRTLLFSNLDKNEIKKFKDWMLEDNRYSKTSVGRMLVRLKTIAREAESEGIKVNPAIKATKSMSKSAQERFIHVLTKDEIQMIKEAKELPSFLLNARKWLMLGISTGARVSDLLSLSSESVVDVDGITMVSMIQQKTGKTVMVPIKDEFVLEVIQDFPRKITDIKLNEYLKELCKRAGIISNVKGYKRIDGKHTLCVLPKYEFISSHAMRRTFATTHYGKIPTPLIMQMTGHSREKVFLQYIGKTDDIMESAKNFAKYL